MGRLFIYTVFPKLCTLAQLYLGLLGCNLAFLFRLNMHTGAFSQ